MSIFVQLPPADYSRTAFDQFRPLRAGFDLDDARAMMWMSQLAYETDTPQTIAEIAPLWSFKPIELVRAQARQIDTRAIVGERADCIVVAFAGTDPALSKNLMTDVDCRLTPNDTHEGFQAAIDAAWPQVETKITALIQASPRPVFFSGHSLGAAMAVLAAEKVKDGSLRPTASLHLWHAASGWAAFQNPLQPHARRLHLPARPWRRHGCLHARFCKGARDAHRVSTRRPSVDVQIRRQVRPGLRHCRKRNRTTRDSSTGCATIFATP